MFTGNRSRKTLKETLTLIQHIEDIAKDCIRNTDIMLRYHANKLLFILVGCKNDGVEVAVERIHGKISNILDEEITGTLGEHSSISIGYSMLKSDHTAKSLIEDILYGLYHAIENGGHQTWGYTH